jgi:hypothetical protein
MKTVLSLIFGMILIPAICSAAPEQINHETTDQIHVAVKITSKADANGNALDSEPSITILPGKKSRIDVTRIFATPNFGLARQQIPVGIILEIQADIRDGKVVYSGLVTIREFKEGKLNAANGEPVPDHPGGTIEPENYTDYFKTIEIALTGKAVPKQAIVAKFDDGLAAAITFTILNPDGSSKQ